MPHNYHSNNDLPIPIQPPRATELQLLSNSQPQLVYIQPPSPVHNTRKLEREKETSNERERERERRTLRNTKTHAPSAAPSRALSTPSQAPTVPVTNAQPVSEEAVVAYYSKLKACMNKYTTEDYASALQVSTVSV